MPDPLDKVEVFKLALFVVALMLPVVTPDKELLFQATICPDIFELANPKIKANKIHLSVKTFLMLYINVEFKKCQALDRKDHEGLLQQAFYYLLKVGINTINEVQASVKENMVNMVKLRRFPEKVACV